MLAMSICRILFLSWSLVICVLVTTSCSSHRTSICLVKNKSTDLSSVCQMSNTRTLSCNENQKIRIVSTKLYRHLGWTDRNCSKCDFNNSEELEANENDMKIQHDLHISCSFRSKCTFIDFSTSKQMNLTLWYIGVNYTCVDNGDIYDMCTARNECVDDKTLYISHVNRFPGASSIHSCYCMFSGHVNITLVEYTPCSYMCQANQTLIYIDGHQHYDCGTECTNTVYFNEFISSTQPTTNITLSSTGQYGDLFWISIQKSSEGAFFVSCNENNSFVIPTPTTVATVTSSDLSQPTSSAQYPTRSTRNTQIIQEHTSTSTCNDKLNISGEPESETFPLMTVLAVLISIVVIIVIIIVVFLCKRAQTRKVKRRNSNKYNTVQFQTKKMKTKILNGIVNESYEESNADKGQLSEIEENGTDGIDPFSEYTCIKEHSERNPSKSVVDYANVGTAVKIHRSFDVVHTSNIEPDPIQSVDDTYSKLTTASHQRQEVLSTYDTFNDNTEYSHIQAKGTNNLAPRSDIYSHLNLPVKCATKTVDVGLGSTAYNHITLNAENLTSHVPRSDAGNL